MTSSSGNIFRVTVPLCGEFTGHLWIPLTKASDAELWCFLYLRWNKRLTNASYLRCHRVHCDVNVTRIDPHCCSDQQEMNMISSITDPLWGNSSKLLMDFPNKWAVMRKVFQFYDDLILNKLNLNHRNTEARSCSWDLLTWINRNE